MSKAGQLAHFDPNGVGLANGHFIGLPFEEADAAVVLLSVPWDVTVSYGAGTASGPENILQASPQLDLYDELAPAAWKSGLFMRPSPAAWAERSAHLRRRAEAYIAFLEAGGQLAEAPDMQATLAELNAACAELHDWVEAETAALLAAGKKVGVVGGEHSVPLGFLRALARHHGEFGILQIDAHCDLRVAYEGFTYSHASIFYNALQIPAISRLVQVGIRDYCEAEAQMAAQSGGRIHLHSDLALRQALFSGLSFNDLVARIIADLPQKVYISFDIDGLDPALCPHTGTPVPGGLQFAEAMHLLHSIHRSGRQIIGFDLCETAGLGHEWDGNVGARVLYQLCTTLASSFS